MRRGDLIADLTSHAFHSRMIVSQFGWDLHYRLLGALFGTNCGLDDEIHYYLRPDASAPNGIRIDIEIVSEKQCVNF